MLKKVMSVVYLFVLPFIVLMIGFTGGIILIAKIMNIDEDSSILKKGIYNVLICLFYWLVCGIIDLWTDAGADKYVEWNYKDEETDKEED